MKFSLNGAELSLNLGNSEKLRNHWSMNCVQYKSLSLTQEVLGSNPAIFLFDFWFLIFRENSNVIITCGHEATQSLVYISPSFSYPWIELSKWVQESRSCSSMDNAAYFDRTPPTSAWYPSDHQSWEGSNSILKYSFSCSSISSGELNYSLFFMPPCQNCGTLPWSR